MYNNTNNKEFSNDNLRFIWQAKKKRKKKNLAIVIHLT